MFSEDNLPFGVWLEREIYRRNTTKSELAALLRVSPSVITQWTSGETEPSSERIAALAKILAVTRHEILLRLGRVESRPDLDVDWEVFISKVERDGVEFKRFVLGGLDDMRSAWLTRPRRAQAIMRVAAASLFDYSARGMRGAADWPGERLLYYGPIAFSDGSAVELMLVAEQSSETGYTFCAELIDGALPERGTLYVRDETLTALRTGTTIRFPPIVLDEADPPVTFIFERPLVEGSV